MAGIAGVYGTDASQNAALAIVGSLRHRGPDSVHVSEGPNYAVACCQLHASGQRKHAYVGGDRQAIVFDGMLLNRRHTYLTDAELVRDLIETYGRRGLEQLVGPHAVAVANADELLLARDHMGMRPLYYCTDGETVWFASEMKALLDRRLSVRKLPPGYVFSTVSGLHAYPPTPHDEGVHPSSDTETSQGFMESLREGVEKCLRDGAVEGVSLQADPGSVVVASLALAAQPELPVYVSGVAGSEEVETAARWTEQLGARGSCHTHTCRGTGLRKLVREAVWSTETAEVEAVDRAVCALASARMTRSRTRCVIGGEGLDAVVAHAWLLSAGNGAPVPAAPAAIEQAWLSRSVAYRIPLLDPRLMRNAISRFGAHTHGPTLDARPTGPLEAALDGVEGLRARSVVRRCSERRRRTAEVLDAMAPSATAEAPPASSSSPPRARWYCALFEELFNGACAQTPTQGA